MSLFFDNNAILTCLLSFCGGWGTTGGTIVNNFNKELNSSLIISSLTTGISSFYKT